MKHPTRTQAHKPPQNRLSSIDTLHREVFGVLIHGAYTRVSHVCCRRWALTLQTAFRCFEGVDIDYLNSTLRQYEGKKCTNRWVDIISRQLAARKNELQQGPLSMYVEPCAKEWLAVELYAARRTDLHFYCLTGTPAGHMLTRRVDSAWVTSLSTVAGCGRRIPYHQPSDLVGCRFWSYCTPAGTTFDMSDWYVDSRMRQSNKQLLQRRRHLSDTPSHEESACPMGHKHYCHECQEKISDCYAVYQRGLS